MTETIRGLIWKGKEQGEAWGECGVPWGQSLAVPGLQGPFLVGICPGRCKIGSHAPGPTSSHSSLDRVFQAPHAAHSPLCSQRAESVGVQAMVWPEFDHSQLVVINNQLKQRQKNRKRSRPSDKFSDGSKFPMYGEKHRCTHHVAGGTHGCTAWKSRIYGLTCRAPFAARQGLQPCTLRLYPDVESACATPGGRKKPNCGGARQSLW